MAALGGTVTGTASGSVSPYSCPWNFEDGTTPTAANPTMTYAAPGTYCVSLAVIAADSTNTTAAKDKDRRTETS